MRKTLLLIAMSCLALGMDGHAQRNQISAPGRADHPGRKGAEAGQSWRQKVREELPLLGDRNWVLVVDSAYPLESAPGIVTVETGDSQLDVVRGVLDEIHASIHVRPVVFMDAELPFVPEAEAPGVSQYRAQIASLLHGLPVHSLLHAQSLADIAEAAKTFRILVLKTNMTIPYTSLFIRLDCKYWSAEAESRLRTRMEIAGQH